MKISDISSKQLPARHLLVERVRSLHYGSITFLKLDHPLHLTRDALKSPDHKKYFNFALGFIQHFLKARQFWCGRLESGHIGRK